MTIAPVAVSVVMPIYNEAESLPQLHEQLSAAAAQGIGECEFVIVNDGSTDETWEALVALRRRDPRVRPIRWKRYWGTGRILRLLRSTVRPTG